MNDKINKSIIESSIQEHISVTEQLYGLSDKISEIAEIIYTAIKDGKKVLWIGNGGSAADCQHLAAEFVGRFEAEREGFSAIALTTDTSILTAVSNDYGFKSVFKRQVEALCNEKDIVVGITTSGTSSNVIAAMDRANELGAISIGMTGRGKTPIEQVAHYCLKVPSTNTARIQEMHILCGHIICEIVEHTIVNSK